MNEHARIRPATPADSEALLEIYRPSVIDTAVSFELTLHTPEEFSARIQRISYKYPWLVAAVGLTPVGYAYASAHRSRAAYRFSVETTIYVDPAHQGRGIGRALYAALFQELAVRKYCNAYAGVTLPNDASVALHQNLGFESIGVFRNVGFKFDRWHDVAWFHKPISVD